MFNIPNLFTAANLLSGILSITYAFEGRLDWACYAIFAGAVFDFFDGFLARKLNKQGELGKQLDSLADVVTFGTAPGILMYVLLNQLCFREALGMPSSQNAPGDLLALFQPELAGYAHFLTYLPYIAFAIPFFSLFRLAKFNLDTRQSESFIGLPTPANTIFFTSFPLILMYGGDSGLRDFALNIWVITVLIIGMSLLLISELPLFSLKFKHFKWSGNEIRYVFLISCGIVIPTLQIWAIPIIILLYLLLSAIAFIFAKNTTK